MEEKEYEVWQEGFAVAGQYSPAIYRGKHKAKSFEDACYKAFDGYIDVYPDGTIRSWTSKLFDNEKDARRSFG